MMKKLTARECAVKYCSISKHTKKTLERLLTRKGYSEEDIYRAVSAMEDMGYIDEEEYIRAFINDSVKIKKHGKMRIVRDLIFRGIDEERAKIAVENQTKDEIETIREIYLKKFSGKEIDKNKVYRYFIYRGFALCDIRRGIDE